MTDDNPDGMLILGDPLETWRFADHETTQVMLSRPTRRDLGVTLSLASKARDPGHDWSKP